MFDFRKIRLIVFASLLSAFPPLTTDMYLPALPNMVEYFNVPLSVVNLTLMVFFVFFAASILFWGPLSDKYGRKPMLIIGTSIFVVGSIGCVFSTHINALIAFRALQATGGGAAVAISMAILKDVFGPREREKALAVVSVIMATAPVISPVIGAALLSFTSWRGVFVVLTLIGIVSLVSCIFMKETMPQCDDRGIMETLGRLRIVYTNRSFSFLLFLFSIYALPIMGFIGTSSNIYINGFGVSEQIFSYYFALNAIFFTVGPVIYFFLANKFSQKNIIAYCFAVMFLGGFATIFFGGISPLVFTATIIPFSLAGSISKPPTTNMILEQVDKDAGTASSLIGFMFSVFGSFGIMIASIEWASRIVALGIMFSLVGLVCLIGWIFIGSTYLAENKT